MAEGSEEKAGVGMTDDERDGSPSGTEFRKWIGRIAVVALLLWALQILGFVTYSVLTQTPPSNGWLNKLIQDHYPAMIGIPLMSLTAICIVMCFQVAIGGPIEFEALGFKFRGASGPVLMWVLCFLALTLALRVLWSI
jgi:hypothetical protein